MVENATSVSLLILSIHQEMGENFVQDVCGSAGSSATIEINGSTVHMDVLAGDPRLNAAWDDTLKKAHAIVVLVRFLDVISLDKIKAIYRRIPGDKTVPLGIVIVRENGEADFKISCPVCGQKLWVRDADSGKRGRCPNCKKAFPLPDQVAHIKGQLALADNVPVVKVPRGNTEGARQAVLQLVGQISSDGLVEHPDLDQDVLKQATIRVQINPDDV